MLHCAILSGMILKRYGAHYHSVTPNFDARAMNEIGFQRSHELSIEADAFARDYQRVEQHELDATAGGLVQMEAEQAVLDDLRRQLDELQARHGNGRMLLVESEQGRDYPKLHERITTLVVEGENKLHFHRSVDPPLRIGVYAPRQT